MDQELFCEIETLTAERLTFPLRNDVITIFEDLRAELLHASLAYINDYEPFTVECDASDFAIAAILNQGGQLVACMSRRLSRTDCKYPTVEEATSTVEAVRKWSHYLYTRPFTLITDEQFLKYMFDQTQRERIKNAEMQAW